MVLMTKRCAVLLLAFIASLASAQEAPPYGETLRPQFHFTYRVGWLSDINGPFYYDGEYHLFTQHRPGNPALSYPDIHWGHAVSRDLLHWEELAPALAPDEMGPAFSGSCVVDVNNVSGLKSGREAPILAFYTAAPYAKPGGLMDLEHAGRVCIAFSNDRGRTWAKYAGNPVAPVFTPGNRDPKVLYHAASNQWIMIITLNTGAWNEDNGFMMLTSANLKEWKELWRFEMPTGCDCPDMFELPVDGNAGDKRWVIWSGDTTHMIGRFDGSAFIREGPIHKPLVEWMRPGAGGYAAQTFVNMPPSDGRCIQVSWIRQDGELPGMPFNQYASFPCELSLRRADGELHLRRYPVREIERLHERSCQVKAEHAAPGGVIEPELESDTFDVDLRIELGDVGRMSLDVRGVEVVYDAKAQALTCKGTSAPLTPRDGAIALRILVDRCGLEIFGNDGCVVLYYAMPLDAAKRSLQLITEGGRSGHVDLKAYTIRPIWADKVGGTK